MFNVVYALLLILLLLPCADAESLQPAVTPCTLVNTIVSVDSIIDISCVNVTYSGVTLQAALILAVGNMSSSSLKKMFLFDSIQMQAGSSLQIDATGGAPYDSYAPSVSSTTVSIKSLSSTDGCVLFRGIFPPYTSILLDNVTLSLEAGTGATFPSIFCPLNHFTRTS